MPDNGFCRFYLGISYLLQGRTDDGLREFQHAIRIQPQRWKIGELAVCRRIRHSFKPLRRVGSVRSGKQNLVVRRLIDGDHHGKPALARRIKKNSRIAHVTRVNAPKCVRPESFIARLSDQSARLAGRTHAAGAAVFHQSPGDGGCDRIRLSASCPFIP